MDRSDALFAWVQAAAPEHRPDTVADVGDALQALVGAALPSAAFEGTGLDAVLHALGGFYGPLTYDGTPGGKPAFVMELVLGCCVQGDAKHDAVAAITELSTEVQLQLAGVIQDVMATYGGGDDNPCSPCSSAASPAPTEADSVREMPRSLLEREYLDMQRDVADLREAVAALKAEARAAPPATASAAEARLRQQQTSLLEAEMAAMKERSEREEEIATILAAKDASLAQLQAQVARLSGDTQDAQAMRDELDVLRSQSAELAKAQALNAKFRQQLETLSEVEGELATLQSQNKDLVDANVHLQADADRIPTMKAQLDTYRQAKCEAEVKASELAMAATEAEAALVRAREELSTLKRGKLEQEAHAAASMAAEMAMGRGGATALGDGLSELNPEMMEKMTRLEAENRHLKEEAEAAAGARVVELEDQLEDVTRLKVSMEGQWAKEKAGRAEANHRADTAEDEVTRLAALLDGTTKALEVASARAGAAETALAALQVKWNQEHQGKVVALQRAGTAEAALAALQEQHDTLVVRAQVEHKAKVAALETRLGKAEEQWDAEKSARSLAQSQRDDLQRKLSEVEAAKHTEKVRAAHEDTILGKLKAALGDKTAKIKALEDQVVALTAKVAAPPTVSRPATRSAVRAAAAGTTGRGSRVRVQVEDTSAGFVESMAKMNAEIQALTAKNDSSLVQVLEATNQLKKKEKEVDDATHKAKTLEAELTRLKLRMMRAGQDPDAVVAGECAKCAAAAPVRAAPEPEDEFASSQGSSAAKLAAMLPTSAATPAPVRREPPVTNRTFTARRRPSLYSKPGGRKALAPSSVGVARRTSVIGL